MDDAAVQDLLREHGAGDLVTGTDAGAWSATMLAVRARPGRRGPPARCSATSPATTSTGGTPRSARRMVILRGPDAYVTPNWYAAEGRARPRRPDLELRDGPRLRRARRARRRRPARRLVRRLTEKHEAGRAQPWTVDDAPPTFVAGQLRAIVGVELLITRIEAKAKLSQNRPPPTSTGWPAGTTRRGGPGDVAAVDGRPAVPASCGSVTGQLTRVAARTPRRSGCRRRRTPARPGRASARSESMYRCRRGAERLQPRDLGLDVVGLDVDVPARRRARPVRWISTWQPSAKEPSDAQSHRWGRAPPVRPVARPRRHCRGVVLRRQVEQQDGQRGCDADGPLRSRRRAESAIRAVGHAAAHRGRGGPV